jgi:hypothetical protein
MDHIEHPKCVIVWLLVYSQICAIITIINFGTFLSIQKEKLHLEILIPYILHHTPFLPSHKTITILRFISIDLPGLCILPEWNHISGGFFYIA